MERFDTLRASFHLVKRDMHVLEHDICYLFESKGIENCNEARVSDFLEHLKLVVVDVAREASDGDLLVGRSRLLRNRDMVVGTKAKVADPLVGRPWRDQLYATVCLDREPIAPSRLRKSGPTCSKQGTLATRGCSTPSK